MLLIAFVKIKVVSAQVIFSQYSTEVSGKFLNVGDLEVEFLVSSGS